MAKENLKLINDLQKLVKEGETKLDDDFVSKYKIDKLKNLKFRNLEIDENFWGNYVVKIIDEDRDLDGNEISENKQLLKKLKSLSDNDVDEIELDVLVKMNILTPATRIRVGNFSLKSKESILDWNISDDCYKISIFDEEKNIDNLWTDEAITKNRILDVLHDFEFNDEIYKKNSETKLNSLLEKHFKTYFENIKKSSTSNKGLIDLVIGENNDFGIEMKLARELKKTDQCDRAVGQFNRYSEEFEDEFLIVVFGTLEEKNEKYVKVLRNTTGKAKYYYKET